MQAQVGGRYTDHGADELSILYLRCAYDNTGAFSDAVIELSILYLRCVVDGDNAVNQQRAGLVFQFSI